MCRFFENFPTLVEVHFQCLLLVLSVNAVYHIYGSFNSFETWQTFGILSYKLSHQISINSNISQRVLFQFTLYLFMINTKISNSYTQIYKFTNPSYSNFKVDIIQLCHGGNFINLILKKPPCSVIVPEKKMKMSLLPSCLQGNSRNLKPRFYI